MSKYLKEPAIIESSRNNRESLIAKIYFLTIVVRMISQLSFISGFIGSAADYLAIIPHFFGILLVIRRTRWTVRFDNNEEGNLLSLFLKMVLWFSANSVVMATVMQITRGSLGGETAFEGIAGMLIYWMQYFFILYYNYEAFKILKKDELYKLLKIINVGLLILGYIQIGVTLLGGAFARIYDAIDVFDILCDSGTYKLALTGFEGANAGYMMSMIVFPFLYANIVNKRTGFISVILWLPILYYTHSSTAWLLFIIETATFIILFLILYFHNIKGSTIIWIAFSLCLLIPTVNHFQTNDSFMGSDTIKEELQYLVVDRLSDTDNGSNELRKIPIQVDLGAFSEYPIFGVGNGCQGYFYEKYFPRSLFNTKGVNAVYYFDKFTNEQSTGALFWLGTLSGYGIVGGLLLLVFFYKCILLMIKKHKRNPFYSCMYFIALPGTLFAGMLTDFVAKYFVWLIFSLPLMLDTLSDNKEGSLDGKILGGRNGHQISSRYFT